VPDAEEMAMEWRVAQVIYRDLPHTPPCWSGKVVTGKRRTELIDVLYHRHP